MQRLIEKQKKLEQVAKQQLLIQQQQNAQQNSEKDKKEKSGTKDKDKEGANKVGEISKDPRIESKFISIFNK